VKIIKFGGDCLADPIRFRLCLDTLRTDSGAPAVVVSAVAGVTDALIRAADAAAGGEGSYPDLLDEIRDRHLALIRALLPPKDHSPPITALQLTLNELDDILHGVELVGECTPRTLDLVMSFGERIAAQLFTAYAGLAGIPGRFVDARDLIVTDGQHGRAVVDYAESYSRIRAALLPGGGIPVITGFIASTRGGATTTLGRNGSDYTASIVGAALGAEVIEIWTGAEGVRSASPEHVPDAFVLPQLSYREAMELSYFGARIIHPFALLPAVERGIPIRVRRLDAPGDPGTLIGEAASAAGTPVAGLASVDRVATINVEGGGMIGIPGMAARIFAAMAHAGVNIMMISQASSEQSICLALREAEAERALAALEAELEEEVREKRIQRFECIRDLAIVAVIGDRMRGHPGMSGSLFSVLGREGINVLVIAQGSSERNISFVISRTDEARALRALHAEFLSPGARV
jgi:bifunctional aspartokinase / homoserine dehydrogenase 1